MLREPGVTESFLGGNALLGVVDEDPTKKVEELLVEGIVRRDDLLLDVSEVNLELRRGLSTYVKLLHCLDEFP